jgi:hypothetical protein
MRQIDLRKDGFALRAKRRGCRRKRSQKKQTPS